MVNNHLEKYEFVSWAYDIPDCSWKVIQNSMVPVTTNQSYHFSRAFPGPSGPRNPICHVRKSACGCSTAQGPAMASICWKMDFTTGSAILGAGLPLLGNFLCLKHLETTNGNISSNIYIIIFYNSYIIIYIGNS